MLSNQNANWTGGRGFNSIARKAMILVVGPPKSWRLAAAAYKSASHDSGSLNKSPISVQCLRTDFCPQPRSDWDVYERLQLSVYEAEDDLY